MRYLSRVLRDFPAKMGEKMHDAEKIFAERGEKGGLPSLQIDKNGI
jgi:hypothetical protein